MRGRRSEVGNVVSLTAPPTLPYPAPAPAPLEKTQNYQALCAYSRQLEDCFSVTGSSHILLSSQFSLLVLSNLHVPIAETRRPIAEDGAK